MKKFCPESFERTWLGKLAMGILLIGVGIGTSGTPIGLPIAGFGAWLILSTGFKCWHTWRSQPE